jgi:hypothetical protein
MSSDSGENLPPTWAESIILRSRLLHFLGGDLRLVENALSSDTVLWRIIAVTCLLRN